MRGEENDDIPNSKHDKKIHEPGKKILYDWLRYVRWESLEGQLHQIEWAQSNMNVHPILPFDSFNQKANFRCGKTFNHELCEGKWVHK